MDKLKELLDLVYNLEGELDDAYYSLPDYQTNQDGKSYVDGARCTLYELKSQMEKIKKDVDEVTLEEVMNVSPTLAKLL
jgi:hypothetical protein